MTVLCTNVCTRYKISVIQVRQSRNFPVAIHASYLVLQHFQLLPTVWQLPTPVPKTLHRFNMCYIIEMWGIRFIHTARWSVKAIYFRLTMPTNLEQKLVIT